MHRLTNDSLSFILAMLDAKSARQLGMTCTRMRQLYNIRYDFSADPIFCQQTCDAYAQYASETCIQEFLINPHHYRWVRYVLIADLAFYNREKLAIQLLEPLNAIGALTFNAPTSPVCHWCSYIGLYACYAGASLVLRYLLDCNAITPYLYTNRILFNSVSYANTLMTVLNHRSCILLSDDQIEFLVTVCDAEALAVLLRHSKVTITTFVAQIIQQRLQKAFRKANLEIVHSILEYDRILDWTSIDFAPALLHTYKLCLKSYNLLSYLVHHRRWQAASYNQFSLRWACSTGDVALAKDLLDDQTIDPAFDDQIAFLIACKNGHAPIVSMLLADNRIDPTRTTPPRHGNYLNIAIKKGHQQVVECLLRDGRLKPHHYKSAMLSVAQRTCTEETKTKATKLLRTILQDDRFNPFHLNDVYYDYVKNDVSLEGN